MTHGNQPEPFQNLVVFDIETIPDTSLAGELCDIPPEKIEKMSQPETRREMENYHIDNHNGNAFLRQPFHRIACISFLVAKIEQSDYGKEEYTFHQLDSYSSFSATEEEVVKKFWSLLQEKQPRIVTFNGKIFDINVLKCKALKYNIDCSWYFSYGGKFESYEYPYSNSHFDCLNRYGSYTLHEMCILLGIPCKLGVDGSHVADYFDEKKYNEIREYCETDVLATYLVYLKMSLVEGRIDKTHYNQCITDIENHLIAMKDKKKGLKEFLEAWHKLNPKGILI